MIQVIYGDILLLIDFCMNFFVLHTTALLLRRSVKAWTLAGASVIGGIYSVAKVFVNGNDVLDCIISLGVGCLMCYITFGGYRYLKSVLVFFGTAAVVGGIMFGVYFLMGSYHGDMFGNLRSYAYAHIPLWLFTLLAAISLFLSWILSYFSREDFEKREERICLEYGGERKEFSLLMDSGNLVKEPISGKNVIFLTAEKAKTLFSPDLYSAIVTQQSTVLLKRKFRIVNYHGMETQNALCYGFFPDRLFFQRGGRTVELDACVALCASAFCGGEIDGIAHPSLFL